MTPLNENKPFTALGALGYSVSGGAVIALFFANLNRFEKFPLSPIIIIAFGGALAGFLGGLVLGSIFQIKRKMIRFAFYSALSGAASALALLLSLSAAFSHSFGSSLIGIYLTVIAVYGPFVLGSFLVATSLMYVYCNNLKRALFFGLYGIVAGVLAHLVVYFLSWFPFVSADLPHSSEVGMYLFFIGWEFFNGGLVGFFFKNQIMKKNASETKEAA